MAWRQPLPATSLCLANYKAPMEDPPKPYPFGLEGAGSTYQNDILHLIVDHVERDHVIDLYMIDPTDSGQPAPWSAWWLFASFWMNPLFRPNLSTTF